MTNKQLLEKLKEDMELRGHSCIRSTMTYVHVANNMQKVKSPLDIYLEKEGVVLR